MNRFIKTLLYLNCLGIISYWAMMFFGLAPFMRMTKDTFWIFVFPVADTWVLILASLTLINNKKNPRKSAFYGVSFGASLIFLSFYALGFDMMSGLQQLGGAWSTRWAWSFIFFSGVFSWLYFGRLSLKRT